MATLAPSLTNLFREIDARWPNRPKGTDGWIGDKAHQQTKSDHNPDSRGIVHAIDITKYVFAVPIIITQCIRNDRPTNYVVYDRRIWSRSHGWRPHAYTGSNPHTTHIHVSILHGSQWETGTWRWGIADLSQPPDPIVAPGPSDDMGDWSGYFRSARDTFVAGGDIAQHAADALTYHMR